MHVCVFVSELLFESFRERPGARKQKETQAVIFLMNYSGLFASVLVCVFVCEFCTRALCVFDCVLCKSTIIGLLTVDCLVWETKYGLIKIFFPKLTVINHFVPPRHHNLLWTTRPSNAPHQWFKCKYAEFVRYAAEGR